LPMFENDYDGYLLLEVHYDNKRFVQDVVDHSGLRMYLTPTKQQIEAGVMLLTTPEDATKQIIPPGESQFRFYSYFDSCLRNTIPKEGTELAFGLLHQHLYGRQIRLHHFRNGTQLAPILEDNNYDFYYQQYRRMEPKRRIYSTDNLVLECVYDTTKTKIPIFGGFSTAEEMCESTFLYYPRVSSGFGCVSGMDPEVYVPMFGGTLVDSETVKLPNSDTTVSLQTFAREHLDWSIPNIRETFQEFSETGSHIIDFNYTPLRKPNSTTTDNPVQHTVFQQNGYKVPTPPSEQSAYEKYCSEMGNTAKYTQPASNVGNSFYSCQYLFVIFAMLNIVCKIF